MSLGLRTIDKRMVSLTLTTIMALGFTRFVNARCVWAVVVLAACFPRLARAAEGFPVLQSAAFAHYIEGFNSMEDENWTNFISNAES